MDAQIEDEELGNQIEALWDNSSPTNIWGQYQQFLRLTNGGDDSNVPLTALNYIEGLERLCLGTYGRVPQSADEPKPERKKKGRK